MGWSDRHPGATRDQMMAAVNSASYHRERSVEALKENFPLPFEPTEADFCDDEEIEP
jgi:hypothetical protein